jgi:hypothetical protein
LTTVTVRRHITYRCVLTAAVASLALVLVTPARALGGDVAFVGGSSAERAEVLGALEASRFNWNVVPAQITIHIAPGEDSRAAKGEIWLDADLLGAGTFAWGVVQHEYAHQVDFFLLDDDDRALLMQRLGADTWCSDGASERHDRLGCERFASTLAWSYWSSPLNCLKPEHAGDESAAMSPSDFRALISTLIRARVSRRFLVTHRSERGV